MKTYTQWTTSHLNMSQFLQPGDQVDEAMFDYALGALPPAYYRNGIMAMGEPTSHTRDGIPLYACFSYVEDEYRYLGSMTIPDAIISIAKSVWETPNCSPKTHGIIVFTGDPEIPHQLRAVPLSSPYFERDTWLFGDYYHDGGYSALRVKGAPRRTDAVVHYPSDLKITGFNLTA
jgi:hypothetical protein